jgi:OOP family OmpA-OmpF porin
MRYAPSRRRLLQLSAAYTLVCVSPPLAARPQLPLNIFFDFESAEMSDAATELADRLAREMLPSARVTLAGNADTAETHPDRISYARGNAVLKHFLRKQSLIKVRFNVVTKGVASPLVSTGPNVKEPRNRRVEISID